MNRSCLHNALLMCFCKQISSHVYLFETYQSYVNARGNSIDSGAPILHWEDDSNNKSLYTPIDSNLSKGRYRSDLVGHNVFEIHEMCEQNTTDTFAHGENTSTFAFQCLVGTKSLLFRNTVLALSNDEIHHV